MVAGPPPTRSPRNARRRGRNACISTLDGSSAQAMPASVRMSRNCPGATGNKRAEQADIGGFDDRGHAGQSCGPAFGQSAHEHASRPDRRHDGPTANAECPRRGRFRAGWHSGPGVPARPGLGRGAGQTVPEHAPGCAVPQVGRWFPRLRAKIPGAIDGPRSAPADFLRGRSPSVAPAGPGQGCRLPRRLPPRAAAPARKGRGPPYGPQTPGQKGPAFVRRQNSAIASMVAAAASRCGA